MPNVKLTVNDKTEIVRLAAQSELTHQQIAHQFNVSPRRVGQIVQEYTPIVQNTQNEMIYEAVKATTGRNIVDRAWRMQQRERDLLRLEEQWTPEAIRTKEAIRSNVAKELGDIAPSQHTVTGTVSHRIIGIDDDDSESPAVPIGIEDGSVLTGEVLGEFSGD